jgi:iron complex outermembrane receptor protein
MNYRLALMASSACAVLAAFPADAQSAPAPAPAATPAAGNGLQDIVVTAQRRAENVQKAPIAIDTVSSELLTQRHITDATKLTQLVPSAQIGQAAGPFPVFFLRGGGSFGTNSLTDSAVTLSLDGVPLARQYNSNGQFFDLERVEVLEGPQGTLYGRNATGGAINLIPQKPKNEFSFDGGLSFGNYHAIQTNAAVNVPLASTLAARASFQSTNHSGYNSDGMSDEATQSARLQLLYEPSSRLSVLLSGDYVHQGGKGAGFVDVSDFSPDQRVGLTDPRVQAIYAGKGLTPFAANSLYLNDRYSGVKAEVNWKTDLGTLTILPAYRHAHLDFNSAYGGSEADNEFDDQESVEARFTSNDRGFLRWIVGGFYLHDKIDVFMNIDNRNGVGNQQIYDNYTDSKAVFADVTAKLTSKLRLIGGIRYTNETKTLDGSLHNQFLANPKYVVVDDSAKASKVTWRAGAQYDVTPTSMIYGTVATSFRSGGFYFTADNPAFKPETVRAYTIGTKNRFFDNKVQLNLELFQWDFTNQQLAYSTRDSAGNQVFATQNAGKTRTRGAEIDLKFQPTRSTQLGLDVQYLHSRFQQFLLVQTAAPAAGSLCSSVHSGATYTLNCQGQTPPNSPSWVVSPTVSQDFDLANGGSVNLLMGAHYQTKSYTAINLTPTDLQDSYITGNLALTYTAPGKAWSVGAFVENLGDVAIKQYTAHTVITAAVLAPPRTYGIRAAVHFK